MNEELEISIMNKLVEVVCNSDEIPWSEKGSTIADVFKDIMKSIY